MPTFTLYDSRSERRLLIADPDNPTHARAIPSDATHEDSVEAPTWLAAKAQMGFDLSPQQRRLLRQQTKGQPK